MNMNNKIQVTKFYKPSEEDQRYQRIANIEGQIQRQQMNIAELLKKYETLVPKQSQGIQLGSHQKISKRKRFSSLTGREPKISQIIFPQIKTKKSSSKTMIVNDNKIKPKQIYKYQTKRLNNEGLAYPPKYRIDQQQSLTTNVKVPKPIPYRKQYFIQNNENDSSQEGQVTATFYQKQIQSKLQEQSMEQINFLYFSKDQQMKEWSQQILAMFTKHDMQLVKIKRKNKFLEEFDQKYFTAEAYCWR